MSDLKQKDVKLIKDYLGRKLSEGKLILFTGAGFSANAKDTRGRNLPLSNELAKEISNLVGINEPNPSLKDIFHVAKLNHKNATSIYLKERLTVDSNSLSDEYRLLINQPWYKVYTVNIDDLFRAAQSKFNFDRRIVCMSNNVNSQKINIEAPKDLIVTHLNGVLEDIPDKITFSQEQYSGQMMIPDSYYSVLASEILQYPFVFLGSKLDEDVFWHYIYLRKTKGSIRSFRELRPRSFIVIPKLSLVRQALLREFNITWIPQTCKQFSESFLSSLELESQKGFIAIKKTISASIDSTVPIVSNLITLDKDRASYNHYLLGAEPSWKDIYSNLAIERDKEKDWIEKINIYIENNKGKSTPIFIFTGTAGDGKTSIAMRIALYLTNQSQIVGWIDRNSNIPPHKIINIIEQTDNLESLFIDTPDMYGSEISQIISQLASRKKLKFIALIARSSKIDRLVKGPLFDRSIQVEEFATYKLTDAEIHKILDLLEEQNLQGVLKQKNRTEQVELFKRKSDRQLIVAMVETTSGQDFLTKICEEFEELESSSQQIYCLVAVATSRKHYLLKEEILLGIGESSNNSTINEIDKLVHRGLLIEDDNRLRVRHRVISQTVCDRLASDSKLIQYYTRLAYVAAIKSRPPASPEQKRMKRLLKTLLNHEVLLKVSSDKGEAQGLYGAIEDLLKDDHHFWLQRGCFELAREALQIAENYLNQSFNLNSDDSLVILSLENLHFKQAIANPHTDRASVLAKEAYDNIIQLIKQRGKLDPYPYHVLGSQGWLWAKKGIKNPEKRKKYLEKLLSILEKGVEIHKLSDELKEIRDKVKTEILHFFVRN